MDFFTVSRIAKGTSQKLILQKGAHMKKVEKHCSGWRSTAICLFSVTLHSCFADFASIRVAYFWIQNFQYFIYRIVNSENDSRSFAWYAIVLALSYLASQLVYTSYSKIANTYASNYLDIFIYLCASSQREGGRERERWDTFYKEKHWSYEIIEIINKINYWL